MILTASLHVCVARALLRISRNSSINRVRKCEECIFSLSVRTALRRYERRLTQVRMHKEASSMMHLAAGISQRKRRVFSAVSRTASVL